MKPRWVAIALLACVLVTLVASARPAAAQDGSDVQRALDVTQAVIDRATGTLACTPGDDRLACLYLSQAISLQASARSSYASGFLRDAAALTLRARDRAYSALRAGADATGGDFVRFSLDRTDALLDRAAPPVREAGLAPALRLLDLAFDLQEQARGLAAEGRPRVALSTTYQARDRALRALRMSETGAGTRPEAARDALTRTDAMLRDAADAGRDPSAKPFYDQAVETQSRAHKRLDAGDPKRAMQFTYQAREELVRALARARAARGEAGATPR